MNRLGVLTPICVALALCMSACSDEGSPIDPGLGAPPDTVSFALHVQPIFNVRCNGCHGASPRGALDLRAPQSYDNLVDVPAASYTAPRVVAGDPQGSVLFDKVAPGGTFGPRMPLGQQPLSDAQVELIRRWIEEGALRN